MPAKIPTRDLASFVRFLEEKGELIRISEPVDPHLEVTEIADRFVKAGENPALLFENPVPGKLSAAAGRTETALKPDGKPVPLLINLYASRQRMAWALGCDSIEEAVAKVEEPLKMGPPTGLWDKVRMLGKLKGWGESMPKNVGKGACQDVVIQGDDLEKRGLLDVMPVLTTWPGDGGPYITFPLVITRNPANDRRNIGMYRMQVYDGRTTGMHWQIHKTGASHYTEYEKRGERMPVCVAVGGPPALTYAATAPLPPDIDEAMFAGFLTGEPVPMTKAVTCDLEVPAEADFVIEGYVDPGERRVEGDFGDHTGFYSLAEEFPVFHVTAITSRRDPIYLTTIVGVPPMEDGWLGMATERLFLPLLKIPLPEVVDYHLPVAACFHNLVIIAIDKKYPGHARKVCQGLWGTGQIMFTKVVVVVDGDVNVHDMNEVLWRVSNAVDPVRDTFFSEGPVDQLDHTTNEPCYGGKMGIDATHKMKGEAGFEREWPPIVEMDPAVKEEVGTKWADLLGRLGRIVWKPMSEFRDIHRRDADSWAVQDEQAHGREVRSMFARISGVYDRMNHLLSFNRDKAWRRNVAARLDGDTWEILDLCAGTGDLALTCRDEGKGRVWIAGDFCPEMLEGSRGKKGAEELVLSAADAMQLPFRDRCVDAITVGFGVRNFADVRRGLAEIARVLRPGGQLMVLEFYRDDREASGEARGVPGLIRFGLNRVIPFIGRIIGKDHAAYDYLPSSMGEFLTPTEFARLLEEYGFTEVIIERQTFGIAHIVGGRIQE